MKQYTLLIIALLSTCNSNAETPVAEKKAQAQHEQKIISHKIQDEMSPLGFWETRIEYPILVDSSNNAALEAINREISLLAEKFRCDDNKGDKQFTASITFLNSSLVSMPYTDTWLCAGMPHPDGRTGAITYDIKTGAKIALTDELIASAKANFSQKIILQLNKTLKAKENGEDCAEVFKWSYFYLTTTGMVFAHAPDDYSESNCAVEIKISNKEILQNLNGDSILLSM